MRIFVLFIVSFLLASCENNQNPDISLEFENKTTSVDSINFYFNSVLDSLKGNAETKELGIAIENFFDKRHIPNYENQTDYLDQNYFLSNFKLFNFNNLKVLVVDCNHQYWKPPSLHLYLYDDTYKLKYIDSIAGNRYHNGEIEIMDWDNDGQEEIVFNLIHPVSSVKFHEWQKVIYNYTNDEGLSNIFEIIEEEIDCGLELEPNFGVRTNRAHSWLSKDKLKITETTHEYNCNEYDVAPLFNSDNWLTKEEYIMIWNEVEGRFLKNKVTP